MNIDRTATAVKILFVALSACGLAGCASYGSLAAGKHDPEAFGEANRQTYAAMIVDPDPQYDTPLQTSAYKAAQAIRRYNADQVKRPERISTRSASGGGSN